MSPVKELFQTVNRLAVGLLDKVQILVCGGEIGVPEPLLYRFQVRSVVQEQSRRGMPQTVEFAVRYIVPFQKLVKLPRGCLRVHNRAVPLSENPLFARPSCPEPHFVQQVLLCKLFEQFKARGVQRDGSRLAAFRRFGFHGFAL